MRQTSSKERPPAAVSAGPYAPLPSQDVVYLLPYRPHSASGGRLRRCMLSTASATAVLGLLTFFFYPSDPTVQLVRARLNHVGLNTSYNLALDLSFDVTFKIRNRDFFSLHYKSLIIAVGYRGRELGFIESAGERVRAKGSSYVNATLDLDGLELVHDVIYLLEDFASGKIPLDLASTISGNLGVSFFHVPMKARLFCDVFVYTKNQTIVPEDCYAV